MDLITLDKYKEIEGLSSTKDDVKLEVFIPSVSQLVKTYCGSSIIDYFITPKVEEFTIEWETDILQLTESPARTILTVEERKDLVSDYEILDPTKYYLDSKTDTVYKVDNSFRNWRTGPGAVRITYTAGYESTPADLLLAVADLVTFYLKDEHKQRQTLSGASIENARSGGRGQGPAFPDHIKRVLDLYKNF